jgi:hypothetical protein
MDRDALRRRSRHARSSRTLTREESRKPIDVGVLKVPTRSSVFNC